MSLDPQLVANVQELQDSAADQVQSADNYFGGGTEDFLPRWQVVEGSWSGDTRDPSAIATLFSRNNLGLYYLSILQNGGAEGYLSSFKIQSDILASMEQAFRARHKGKIRSTMHALAVRSGHSAAASGVLQRYLAAANSWLIAANTPAEGDGT